MSHFGEAQSKAMRAYALRVYNQGILSPLLREAQSKDMRAHTHEIMSL